MAVNFKTDIGDCCITGCTKKGRILGYLGGIKLIYCPIHRKYGQEVINMFLEDIFNFRKSQLTELAKQELLFNGDKILDEENEKRLGSWFRKEIYQTYLKDISENDLAKRDYINKSNEADSDIGEGE